jgi:hypothetical protein
MVKAAEEVLEETTFLEKKVGLFFGHVWPQQAAPGLFCTPQSLASLASCSTGDPSAFASAGDGEHYYEDGDFGFSDGRFRKEGGHGQYGDRRDDYRGHYDRHNWQGKRKKRKAKRSPSPSSSSSSSSDSSEDSEDTGRSRSRSRSPSSEDSEAERQRAYDKRAKKAAARRRARKQEKDGVKGTSTLGRLGAYWIRVVHFDKLRAMAMRASKSQLSSTLFRCEANPRDLDVTEIVIIGLSLTHHLCVI